MRNPERIQEVIPLLQALWAKYPDLRLGQLICGLAGGKDPYFMEEDELLLAIQKWNEK